MIRYEEFKLEIMVCPTCKKEMVDAPLGSLKKVAPKWWKLHFPEQIREKGMVIRSNSKDLKSEKYVCVDCEKDITFICCECKKEHKKTEIQERFGYLPTEYLCKSCYNTIPAKKWDEITEQLTEEHRYDFY